MQSQDEHAEFLRLSKPANCSFAWLCPWLAWRQTSCSVSREISGVALLQEDKRWPCLHIAKVPGGRSRPSVQQLEVHVKQFEPGAADKNGRRPVALAIFQIVA